MKYENFERAKSICAQIEEREKLLSRITSCDEVLFRYSSGSHVLAIELSKNHPSPDYGLNQQSRTFRLECIGIIKQQIEELHIELNDL